jgi:hypothetical protein
MPLYHVRLYREMRLFFRNVEAATPEDAARLAASLDMDRADHVDDECDGENLAALVDVAGDEDYQHSVMVDFEAERMRKTVSSLLEALEEAVQEIEYHHRDLLTEDERCHPRGSGWARVYDKARAAIATARVV